MTTDDTQTEAETSESPADRLTDPDPTPGEHPGGPRAENPPFPAIAEHVAEWLSGDPTGHDMHHVWRVFRLATQFAEELDADVHVAGAAALTHDLHRVMGDGTGIDPAETTGDVREILAAVEFPDEKIPAVQHCVAVHDEYAFRGIDRAAEHLEAEILRDADNLDAMGAVGIGRTFAFGGAHGTPMWDPEGVEYSQLYHFEDKLLRLLEEMNTEPARELAEQRHAFLQEFLERFIAEWHGDA